MVGKEGFEPSRLKASGLKPDASTNYATSPKFGGGGSHRTIDLFTGHSTFPGWLRSQPQRPPFVCCRSGDQDPLILQCTPVGY